MKDTRALLIAFAVIIALAIVAGLCVGTFIACVRLVAEAIGGTSDYSGPPPWWWLTALALYVIWDLGSDAIAARRRDDE